MSAIDLGLQFELFFVGICQRADVFSMCHLRRVKYAQEGMVDNGGLSLSRRVSSKSLCGFS